jgi:hypothetical protein
LNFQEEESIVVWSRKLRNRPVEHHGGKEEDELESDDTESYSGNYLHHSSSFDV